MGGKQIYNGRRYDWLEIAKYIEKRMNKEVKVEKIAEAITNAIGRNRALDWYNGFLVSKNFTEAVKNWGGKDAQEAVEHFFPKMKIPKALKTEPVKKVTSKKPKRPQAVEIVKNELNGEIVKVVKQPNGKHVIEKTPMDSFRPKELTKEQFEKLLTDTKTSPEDFAKMPSEMREKMVATILLK